MNGLKFMGKAPDGTAQPLTLTIDNDGNGVLRVVDAAPFAYDTMFEAIKTIPAARPKYEVETLINAQSIAAGKNLNADFLSKGADEIWFLFNSSIAPWTATASMGPWTTLDNILPTTLFPQRNAFGQAFPTISSPCKSLYIMAVPTSDATSFPTTKFDEAYKLRANWDGRLYFTNNHATDASVVTVKIMRIWRT